MTKCLKSKSKEPKLTKPPTKNQINSVQQRRHFYMTDKPMALKFWIKLEFGNVGFGGEGSTGVFRGNPLGARTTTNNKLNPHDTKTGNQTRATLVGGECSHHCTSCWILSNTIYQRNPT